MSSNNFNLLKVVFVATALAAFLGCAHSPKAKSSAKSKIDQDAGYYGKRSASQALDSKNPFKIADNDEDTQKQLIDKLEKEKTELELQNSILMKALNERKKVIQKLPKGEMVTQFPEFEELIFDQAKTAYKEKDEERLQEAIRILRANQPSSKKLEIMFFWLAQIQEGKDLNSQALVTYNEFIKMFPESPYVPQAKFLKGKLYEKLNLNNQAMKIYADIRSQHPDSRERHFADAKLNSADAKLNGAAKSSKKEVKRK